MTRDELIAWAEKLGPTEEVFPVRAQDVLAPATVRWWAEHAAAAGVPTTKVNDAFAVADRMEKHEPKKIPD